MKDGYNFPSAIIANLLQKEMGSNMVLVFLWAAV